jgi:DNA-binding FadR family transcriptional regulator
VVREAVAALRAEGLITTRQGSGAFVAADLGRRGFRIDPDGLGSLEQVLQVLELRQAIEVEAAALAATRAPAKAIRRILVCLKAFETAIGRGENAVPEDFAFHRAIVEATTNPHFTRLLEFLGHFIIPRQSIRAEGLDETGNTAYLQQIQREHQAIYDAIAARDGEAARAAMRVHLTRAGERYRAFAVASRHAAAERESVAAKS